MTQLIISADDFGLTEGVTRGIAESIRNGVVTRTSAMMCTEGSKWIKEFMPGIEGQIGLHLQLTDGRPLLPAAQVPSLVDETGKFPASWRLLGRMNEVEIRQEWEAQMEALLALGIRPTHLDTHHNTHRFRSVFKVYCEMAQKYNLPTRPLSANMSERLRANGLACADFCMEEWEGEQVTVDSFISHAMGACRKLSKQEAIIEVMCHPGYVDDNLRSRSHYLTAREKELSILCDAQLPDMLNNYEFELAESFVLTST